MDSFCLRSKTYRYPTSITDRESCVNQAPIYSVIISRLMFRYHNIASNVNRLLSRKERDGLKSVTFSYHSGVNDFFFSLASERER